MNLDIRFLLTPGDDSAPVYSWVWNDRLTRGGIAQRLDDMARIGVKTFYVIPESKQFRPVNMPTYLEPDYLTDEYLRLFAFAAEEAEKRGMTLWLYDEDGWPSGSAGGHVGTAKPQLCGRKLEARARTLAAGEAYVPAEDALAAFAADGERLRAKPGSPNIALRPAAESGNTPSFCCGKRRTSLSRRRTRNTRPSSARALAGRSAQCLRMSRR